MDFFFFFMTGIKNELLISNIFYITVMCTINGNCIMKKKKNNIKKYIINNERVIEIDRVNKLFYQ